MTQITSSIERKIMSEIDEMGKYLRNQAINLGGVDGVNGGGGGYPRGKLPQTKVTFDTTESTNGTIPASGLSLVINLNRIRSGDALGDGVILPRHLSSGIGIVTVTMGEIDGSPLITNVNKIYVTNGTLTDLGSGEVRLDIDRALAVTSGLTTYQWYADGPIATVSGINGVYKVPLQLDVKNVTMHLKNSGITITSADIQKSPDGINWTSIFTDTFPSLISGQVYSNYPIASYIIPSGYLIRSNIITAADLAKDLTVSVEGTQTNPISTASTITLTGAVQGTGVGTIDTTFGSGIDLAADVLGVLSAINGGTGFANAGSIIITDNTTIQNGGILDLAGYTITAPRTGNIATGYLQALFMVEGELTIDSNPLRIYNISGVDRTIVEVFLSVNTSPSGSAIIVDIHKNGTTIFTNQANRPQIVDGANTGNTGSIDIPTWEQNNYLTMAVDQTGSSTAGSNLTVHIIYY